MVLQIRSAKVVFLNKRWYNETLISLKIQRKLSLDNTHISISIIQIIILRFI